MISKDLKELDVEYKSNGIIVIHNKENIQSAFHFSSPHTLVVKKKNNKTLVMLDEYLLFNGDISFSDIKLGLVCCGNTRFNNIEVTQV